MLGLKIVKHLYIGHFAVKLLGLCKNHKIYTPPNNLFPCWEQNIPTLGTFSLSLTQNMSFYLPLNMVFLFPAEMADITERAAPAMRHDYQ